MPCINDVLRSCIFPVIKVSSKKQPLFLEARSEFTTNKMTSIYFLLLQLLFALSLEPLWVEGQSLSKSASPALIGVGTYPRATFVTGGLGGNLVSCYTYMDGVTTTLQIASSSNGGQDWAVIGSVAQAPTQTHDLDNCHLVTLASGRILASFRNHDRTSSTSSPHFYRLTISYSDDGGSNWKYLSTATTSGTPGLGLWEPFLQNTLSGDLQIYFANETSTTGSNQNIVSMTSTDGGLTWSPYSTVASCGSTNCRDGMPGIARLGDGSKQLVAVFESLSPDTGIKCVFSSDDGMTWDETTLVYKSSVAGADQGAPQIAYVHGLLVVSFQTNEDTLSPNIPDWNVKVIVSDDSGLTWKDESTVLAACNWAGLITVTDKSLLVMCGATATNDALAQTLKVQ